jgi:hypothetical protein
MPQTLMMLHGKCKQAHKQKTINHRNQAPSLFEKADSNIAIPITILQQLLKLLPSNIHKYSAVTPKVFLEC